MRLMKKSWIALIVVVVAVALLLVVARRDGRVEPPDTADQPLKVGVVLPLTGPAAYVGTSVRNGMDLAAEQLNVKGRSITLIYEDSADETRHAVSAYRKLVSADRVPVVVCVSGGWKALIPLAEEDKRVLFLTAVSPAQVGAMSPWTFRFFLSADSDATLMARYAKETLNLETAALVYVNDEFGNSYREVFTRAFEGAGGRVVLAEGISPTQTDFRTSLTRIKGRNPDAVYLLAYGNNMALVPVQMRELGIEATLLSLGTIGQPDILRQAGEAAVGAYYTSTDFNTFAPQTPELEAFVEQYTARYQQPPVFFEVFGFDTVNLLAHAADSKNATPDAIRAGLLAIRDFNAASGDITFSGDGEANFPMRVYRVAPEGYGIPAN
jgi:branched-chain amino acid transport system substrate-binding protein